MDTTSKLALAMGNPRVIVSVASALSFAAGAGSAYILTKGRLKAHYEELANTEIEEAKNRYRVLHKERPIVEDSEEKAEHEEYEKVISEEEYVSPAPRVVEEVVEEVVEVVETTTYSEEGEEPTKIERNVFKDAKSANSYFDYEEEKAKRSPDAPYIITQEEFMDCVAELPQKTLTYFESDDVLLDDGDVPIDDHNRIVGDENLMRFGHGSKDSKTVYIRNEKMEVEFEVLQHSGNYAKDVLGFLEHSDRPGRGVRKFRGDDV